ncbi:MAG: type II and III secretion system protein family protein, partial [Hyphomicrobiaceae bacterium]
SNGFPVSPEIVSNGSVAVGLIGNNTEGCANSIGFSGTAAALIDPITTGATCLAKQLEAFERTGVLRTLAEPTLTAISGETASFLAGGEFPIPVAQDAGTISIEFKPFGVGLSFTPFVASAQRISLKINTEVSELADEGSISTGVIAVRGLKVRRAATTIELPSGGSMVLAGLIQDDTRQNIDGFPGLKELPILGTLFRSRDFKKAETELVVIVTPVIVKPVQRDKLARPDDNWMPASDGKANFLGHMNRIYGRDEEIPEGDYKGDIGFIIE